MTQAPKLKLIGAARAAEILGVDRSTLSRMVRMGAVPVAMQLPGRTGTRLFDIAEIRRIAKVRAEKAAS